MKTSEIFVDVEIPPVDLQVLHQPIVGIFKKITHFTDFVGNNWIYFFVVGVALLLLVVGPIADWIYAN
ncbi:MAG: hypothetical protein WCV79_03620 [Candidatus Paceibacterota bacterium]|jgi:hypothetical protein